MWYNYVVGTHFVLNSTDKDSFLFAAAVALHALTISKLYIVTGYRYTFNMGRRLISGSAQIQV